MINKNVLYISDLKNKYVKTRGETTDYSFITVRYNFKE